MKEGTLLKIALISSFLGITILLLMNQTIELKEGDILGAEDGEKTMIRGRVINVIEGNNSANIVIEKTEFISITVFDKENLDFLSLNEGDDIEAIGKIDNANGRVGLIADEIRIT